mgnify:FL=1
MAAGQASHSRRGVAPRGVAATARVGVALGGIALLGGVTAVVARRLTRRRRWLPGPIRRADGRWHSVTVNRRPEDVSAAVGPAPLEELGLEVDIRYRPAPGGRGTEVSVRAPHGGVAQQRKIRAALRQAKQLWETGEVLQPDGLGPASHPPRRRPLAHATRAGREDGRL